MGSIGGLMDVDRLLVDDMVRRSYIELLCWWEEECVILALLSSAGDDGDVAGHQLMQKIRHHC